VANQPLLMGIDLGTSSVKVLLTAIDGRVAGQGNAEYAIDRPQPDWAEQHPDSWWRAVVEATHAALRDASRLRSESKPADRIQAIGLSGQMHGVVLLSESHEPLAPAVIWPDQRSGREVAELTAELGDERVIRLSGGRLASGFMAATLLWMRKHDRALLDRAAWVMSPKDALRLRMTGEVATDPSDGSGTGMLSPETRRWTPDLVAKVGVEPDRLPPLCESTTVAGVLRPGVAAELGLPADIPVVVGGADTPAGMLGAGLTSRDSFLLTLSTGGQLVTLSDDPLTDPTGSSYTYCSVLPPGQGSAGWYRMVAILSAGLALRWLRDEVFRLKGRNAYARMLEWASAAPPGSRGLIFLPYLAGERSPHLDPAARGVLVGLTAAHGRAELARAVVEGITLGCYDASRALADAGRLGSSIILAGGGGRSREWQRLVADVFGLPVRHLESGEQAALGACLLAGGGIGALDPSSAAPAWSRLGPVIEPDSGRHQLYGAVYDVFREGYPTLRTTFAKLGAIQAAGVPHA
jgi:xylulokinase